MSTNLESSYKEALEVIRQFADNDELAELRFQLAKFTADTFCHAGEELHAIRHIFGADRRNGESPFGNGNDEVVAVSLLLRIGGQLTSASADLFKDGRHYAAAALLRQLVEVEYLAWAFETRDKDAERWIRSTSEERQSFFAPAKIRKASQGKFRGKDYGYHCELGGHPVPGAHILLRHDEAISQLLLSDLLGHTGRIWDHVVSWAKNNTWAATLSKRHDEMHKRYTEWKCADLLNVLPPPP